MDDGHDLVVRTIREHAGALLRTARRHSLGRDDAHDAYQRAMEIFLRRAATLDPDTAVRWLHVVVANEARAVRRSRAELVAVDAAALDRCRDDHAPDVDERAVAGDRIARSAEALSRLKPQEVTALWLKAQGMSYAEIARSQRWTYTKVNRSLVEGRRAFLRRYAGIESGEECRRWAPILTALVDGEATADQLAAARPHLRRCVACRAALRELRGARPRLAGVLPIGAGVGVDVGSTGAWSGRRDVLVHAVAGWAERMLGWAVKLQGAAEVATGTKFAAVAASAAVLAGGGVAVTVGEIGGGPVGSAAAAPAAAAPVARGGGAAVGAGRSAAVALRVPGAGSTAVAGPAAAPAGRRLGGGVGTGGEFGGGGEFAGPGSPEFAALARPREFAGSGDVAALAAGRLAVAGGRVETNGSAAPDPSDAAGAGAGSADRRAVVVAGRSSPSDAAGARAGSADDRTEVRAAVEPDPAPDRVRREFTVRGRARRARVTPPPSAGTARRTSASVHNRDEFAAPRSSAPASGKASNREELTRTAAGGEFDPG